MKLSTNILSYLKNIFYTKEEVEDKLTPLPYDISKNIILEGDIIGNVYKETSTLVIDVNSAKKHVAYVILHDLIKDYNKNTKLTEIIGREDVNTFHKTYTYVYPIFDSNFNKPIKYVVFKYLGENIDLTNMNAEDPLSAVMDELVYIDSFSPNDTKTVYYKDWQNEEILRFVNPSESYVTVDNISAFIEAAYNTNNLFIGYSINYSFDFSFLSCFVFYFPTSFDGSFATSDVGSTWLPYRFSKYIEDDENSYYWKSLYTKDVVSDISPGFMSISDKVKLDGVAANANKYSLPTASSSTLGGVKVGTNLSISNGVLSATNTTYGTASSSSNGLMSSSDKSKLDGVASNANNYSLPTASSSTLGGVKVGSNLSISNGILSATNTTYGVATTSANGLMSSSDKSKLNGIATGATANTIDSSLSSTSTNAVQNKVINSALAGKASTSVATTSANGLMSSSDKSKLNEITISTLFSQTYNSVDFIKVLKITFLGTSFYCFAWNFRSGSSVGPEINWHTNATFTPNSTISVAGYMYSDTSSTKAEPTLKGKFNLKGTNLYIYLYNTTIPSIGSFFWTF